MGLTFAITWSMVLSAAFGSVNDLSVTDLSGKRVKLTAYASGRPLAIVFLGSECPLANRYAPVLNGFLDRFDNRVGILGVFSNADERADVVTSFVRNHSLRYPIAFDPDAKCAEVLRATRTPEVVLLDANRRIRYRGRIDDRYSIGGRDRGKATRDDLAEAIADVLAGRPVAVPKTSAQGCAISRATESPQSSSVTYSGHVAAIIDARCVSCHRPGSIGPFPLTSFAEVRAKAQSVAEAIDDGRMPPWHASPDHGTFRNDPRLTSDEKQTVARWIADGCPEGNPHDRPPLPNVSNEWTIGTPDRVLSFPKTFDIPATGDVPYEHIIVDPGLKRDIWVKAIEFRPGNRRVVHHCNVYLHSPEATAPTDLFETGPLGSCMLIAYTPGCGPGRYSEGTAKRIPAGWKIHFIVHYSPVGTPQTDRSELGLLLADPATVRKEVATKLIETENFVIPPGAAAHRVEQTWTADRDVFAVAFFPHMHYRGKSFRYRAEYPDGSNEILLDVPAYDFHWQHRYELAEPKRLHAGTIVRCSAVFDNSADNPANPDPTATVRSGTKSTDEMFNGFIDIVAADEDLIEERKRIVRTQWGKILLTVCGMAFICLLVLRFSRRSCSARAL